MFVRPKRIYVLLALVIAGLLAVPSAAIGQSADPEAGDASPSETGPEPSPTPTPTLDGEGPITGPDDPEVSLTPSEPSVPTPTPTLDGSGPVVETVTPEVSVDRSERRASARSNAFQTFECQDGMAGPFECKNVDLESMVPLGGAGAGNGNDVWGWTDPKTDREYALVGSALETTFIDVTDPQNPVTVGALPTAEDAPPDFVLWRDIKVDGNYAFIVSEISGHGMQVFDLKRLRDPGPLPQVFTADALYRGTDDEGLELGNAHNIAINEETDVAYIVGSNTCVSSGPEAQNGGLHMVDISDPESPEFLNCARVQDPPKHNYVHDVQCVIYRGPDADYQGREICFGSNEEVVTIYDVTNKNNPVVISQRSYPEAAYTHQGWLSPNQRFFLFGDEGDETGGTVDNTTTYIMDALDLDDPRVPKPFAHETESIDHNLYIDNGLVYEANYAAGLRILDFNNSSLENGQLNEVGYFDIRPGTDPPEFIGAWSNYPFFESGIVVMSGIEEGSTVLYVLRPTGRAVSGERQGNDDDNNNDKNNNNGDDQRDPDTGFEPTEESGSTLSVTGSELMLFLLLGLALVAVGGIAQRLSRRRAADELRW